MTAKKIPERMCIACKSILPKVQLVRVVRTAAGDFLIDKTGRQAGRGCYICNNPTCVSKVIKSKLLNKAYKMDIGSEVYEKLNADFNMRKD